MAVLDRDRKRVVVTFASDVIQVSEEGGRCQVIERRGEVVVDYQDPARSRIGQALLEGGFNLHQTCDSWCG